MSKMSIEEATRRALLGMLPLTESKTIINKPKKEEGVAIGTDNSTIIVDDEKTEIMTDKETITVVNNEIPVVEPIENEEVSEEILDDVLPEDEEATIEEPVEDILPEEVIETEEEIVDVPLDESKEVVTEDIEIKVDTEEAKVEVETTEGEEVEVKEEEPEEKEVEEVAEEIVEESLEDEATIEEPSLDAEDAAKAMKDIFDDYVSLNMEEEFWNDLINLTSITLGEIDKWYKTTLDEAKKKCHKLKVRMTERKLEESGSSIEVKTEYDRDELDDILWSGGLDRWKDLDDDQKDMLIDIFNDSFSFSDIENMPTITTFNDFIWFDSDEYIEEEEEDLEESKKLDEDKLNPIYDTRASFYGKAETDGDKLYSYNTLVAEIIDGKPVVYNLQSQTTLRHVREWLKQNNFKADSKQQIIKDYGVEDIKLS